MKHLKLLAVWLAIPCLLSAQTMIIHSDGQTLDINLTQMDSITFVDTPTAVPAAIDLVLDTEHQDVGGGFWMIQVAARVTDQDGLPIPDHLPVTFTIEPDIASISAFGFIGNQDMNGETVEGTAFGLITFNGTHTNEEVTVTASVFQSNLTPNLTFLLPLINPVVSLFADPMNWDFSEQNPTEIQVSMYVQEGHFFPVNGIDISFLTTRGRYFNRNIGGILENHAITGPEDVFPEGDDDPSGWANRWLRVTQFEVFPDPRVTDATITVFGMLAYHPDVEGAQLTLNMHHDN